ncbi:substrate-binding domain-containing protein [Microbispora sp. NPDC049125]|uniref:substrate-binding domain-containing protein n=1 Tax=Microbispora sp. NPDC049125 TaxID=3154929 RepID=UPI003465CDF2
MAGRRGRRKRRTGRVRPPGRLPAAGACLVLLGALAGCGTSKEDDGLGAVGTLHEGFRIGLLLPGDATDRDATDRDATDRGMTHRDAADRDMTNRDRAGRGSRTGQTDERAGAAPVDRYETYDRPLITRAVASLCPRCEIVAANAHGDRAAQERQMRAMLDDGVRVVILDPVDPRTTAQIVARAKLMGAKVVAYDRMANGPVDAYAGFDRVQVGQAQGRALLRAIGGRRGPVLLLNGPPGDSDAAELKKGLHQALDGRVTIGAERDIAGWSPRGAADGARQALATLGTVAGVCCASDVMAAEVAAVMAVSGIPEGTPLVGQGPGPGATRRLLDGAQAATVYTSIAAEAGSAARLAVDLACGRTVYGTAMVSNGTTASIPAVIVPPVVVTRGMAAGEPSVRRRGEHPAPEAARENAAGERSPVPSPTPAPPAG